MKVTVPFLVRIFWKFLVSSMCIPRVGLSVCVPCASLRLPFTNIRADKHLE